MTAFIFAFIFLPFGWFIHRMLRYTAQSVGEESPLKTIVEFRVSAWEYFTRNTYLTLIFMAGMVIFLFILVLVTALPASRESLHYFFIMVFTGVIGWFLYKIGCAFNLEYQYWEITKDCYYCLDPAAQSLLLGLSDRDVILTESTVDCIEIHGVNASTSKLMSGHQYYIFTLKDGSMVYLNQITTYFDFLLETYFKNVPQRYIGHKIPWIKPV